MFAPTLSKGRPIERGIHQ